MAKIDLSSLSLTELKSLKERVEKAISRHEKKAKNEALSALRAKAKSMGFSLEELMDGKARPAAARAKSKKPKAAVAYRDPKNSGNTWAGRGARPRWLKEALEKGASLDDFKV